jgi:hypothetical protein
MKSRTKYNLEKKLQDPPMKNGDIATTLNCTLHLYKVGSQIANKEGGLNTPTPQNERCMHCLMAHFTQIQHSQKS